MSAFFFLLVPAFMLLNHACGGGAWLGISAYIDKLPGRPIYWAFPIAGLLAWPALGWKHAIVFALVFLLWRVPEWGRWYSLNRVPRTTSGKPSWWGAILEKYGDRIRYGQIIDPWTGLKRNDYVCFSVRNSVLWAPAALIGWPMLLLGPLQTAAYELGHDIVDPNGIPACELIFGAVIGLVLAAFGVIN